MNRKLEVRQITEGVIWKQLLYFFFPILMGTFFQQMYTTVDTIVVGRFVGTNALAAVGSTSALINLINGFFIGLSSGATVILSQLYGANDRKGISNALHTGIALSLMLGLLVTVLGIFAGPLILQWCKTPASCMDGAVRYIKIYFAGSIATMVYNMASGILRAMGDSKRPMLFLIITCILNIFMDYLWVVVLDMGIEGAAIATVISQIVSAALTVAALFRLDTDIRLKIPKIRITGFLMTNILAIGIPAGLQFITFDLSNLLLQSGINSFGETVVAAWTAYAKTDAIIWMTSGAFGVAITTFVGQNFGAEKYDRIRKAVRVCMGMAVGLIGLFCVLILIFGRYILMIYSDDMAVIDAGIQIMLGMAPYCVLFMPVEVFSGAMRGTGYSVVPTVITCMCVCVFRVLWIMFIVPLHHTVPTLCLAYPISWLLASAVFFIVYLRGRWLKSRIAALGMTPE